MPGLDRTSLTSRVAAAGLVLIAGVVFFPVGGFDFIVLDDPGYVTNNPRVTDGLSADGMRWALTATKQANWHPLTWWSLMLDAEIGGGRASVFHWTNLILHALNGLLVFVVLRRMTGTLWRAAFAAALFAVHPLRVESVAWISERKDVLSAFFMLLTMLAWCRYRDKSSAARYGWVLVLFALGLMAKPMLVTLPAVLLLLDYWPLKRWPETGIGTLIVEKLPLIALSAVSSVITLVAQSSGAAVAGLVQLSVGARVANAIVAYAGYLLKTVWPYDLALPYPHPYYRLTPVVVGGCALLLVAITVLVLRGGRNFPWAPVGWFWYLGTLVPVIGLVQVGSQAMADRYTYVPSIGLFVVASWAGAALFGRALQGRPEVPSAVGAAVLIAFVFATRAQTMQWRDSETLFLHTLRVTESNPMAHVGLGNALQREGRTEEALEQYERAAYLMPSYFHAHLNRGIGLAEIGMTAEAEAAFSRALELEPDNLEARRGLAVTLSRQQRPAEAESHLRAALRTEPEHFETLTSLGNVLATLERHGEAADVFRKALAVRPDDPSALIALGTLEMIAGRWDEARASFERARLVGPPNASLHNNLGVVLERLGDLDGARVEFERALAIQPDHAAAQSSLQRVLSAGGP